MSQPQLYSDVRLALQSLYSTAGASHEAHEFLVYWQGRNVRRKQQSLLQSQRDAQDDTQPLQEEQVMAGEMEGSTWWACVAILLAHDAPSRERLFASQTMLHRIRRIKLVEAVDIELEQTQPATIETTTTTSSSTTATTINTSIQRYCQYMTQQRPNISIPIQTHCQNNQDEHFAKGQVMLITLAWIMLEQAVHGIMDQALQTTIASTMAAISLRLRFTPQSLMPGGAPATEASLCDIHLQALMAVAPTLVTSSSIHHEAFFMVKCIALGAIPDTILGSPGGIRGKLSVDPRCIQAAKEELAHSGVMSLWSTLQDRPQQQPTTLTTLSLDVHHAILITCERWAKFLPLPIEFIQQTVPLANNYLTQCHQEHCQRAALAYLIALYESGSWTVERILATSLGLASEQITQASTKKKQSSKAKKRHKERVNEATTDTSQHQAEMECRHRGEICIHATTIVWESLDTLARNSLQREEAEGEGPVVCLTACANSCLPYLVKYEEASFQPLMLAIMDCFQRVCSHPNRNVRGLAYEPLLTLHQALLNNSDGHQMTETESIVADHFYQCCMRLATGCGYPADYFKWLTEDNDDELENERDDVRGVLRALSGSGEDTYVKPPFPSTQILHRLVLACSDSISKFTSGIPPEAVVHALSALAKPMNHLAEAYAKNEAPSNAANTLATIMSSLRFTADRMNASFDGLPAADCIAVSRLIAMAASSYAPGFAMIQMKATKMPGATATDTELFSLLELTLSSTIKTAILSLIHLPELVAESTLHQTQFDIRGAMRGPGGEDHVGVLVIMRLADESDDMAKLITRVGCNEGSSLLVELCKLHGQLKVKEKQRSPGVLHGVGVTPKSRRILLSTISKLVRLSDGDHRDYAQRMLHELFFTTVASIVAAKSVLTSIDAKSMYQLAEATFDLAAFGTATVSNLFAELQGGDDDQTRHDCIHVLVMAGSYGGKTHTVNQETSEIHIQWGRLRAALSCLIKSMGNPDFSTFGAQAAIALITAECDAISIQCAAGPAASSAIFVESVICEDILQAGAYVKNIGDILMSAFESPHSILRLPNIMHVLQQVATPILQIILHKCPEWIHPNVVDPRNSLCEAWYLTMETLSTVLPRLDPSLHELAGQLISDASSAATLLMLFPSLHDNERNLGMSMDGYHTLAMLIFLKSAYSLGSEMFHMVATKVASQVVVKNKGHETFDNGKAIVGASLFRASSGGLPPWAVDNIPQVFEGFFIACNSDMQEFQLLLCASMTVHHTDLLAGRFIAAMSDTNKTTFVTSSMEEIAKGNWRRFKVLLKQACGGKKKQAGFKLKPSPTNWECDRV